MTKIITVQSFRGGTGKSTIISNLATSLTQKGKKVVIIDTDISSPSLHMHFNIKSTEFDTTYTDCLLDNRAITEATYDITETIKNPKGMLLLIPSAANTKDITFLANNTINPKLIKQSIKDIKKEYKPDYILIDTHPGINKYTIVIAKLADITLNIIQPTKQDLEGLKITNEIINKLNKKTHIIMNKAKKETKNITESIETSIPFAKEIFFGDLKNLYQKQPKHIFSKEINRLTTALM